MLRPFPYPNDITHLSQIPAPNTMMTQKITVTSLGILFRFADTMTKSNQLNPRLFKLSINKASTKGNLLKKTPSIRTTKRPTFNVEHSLHMSCDSDIERLFITQITTSNSVFF